MNERRNLNLQDTPKPLKFTLQDLRQGRLTSFPFFSYSYTILIQPRPITSRNRLLSLFNSCNTWESSIFPFFKFLSKGAWVGRIRNEKLLFFIYAQSILIRRRKLTEKNVVAAVAQVENLCFLYAVVRLLVEQWMKELTSTWKKALNFLIRIETQCQAF